MPRVPKITSPCPLKFVRAPQPGVDFCANCQRRVVNLDLLNATQREAFACECVGEVCVSYSVTRKRSRAAALGLSVALSVSSSAWALNPPRADSDPAPSKATQPMNPVGNASEWNPDEPVSADAWQHLSPAQNASTSNASESLEELVVGGIGLPAHETQWVDADSEIIQVDVALALSLEVDHADHRPLAEFIAEPAEPASAQCGLTEAPGS